MRNSLVKVLWRDIIGTAGWEKAEDVEPPIFESIGWLVQKNRHTIKVATTKDEKGHYFAIHAFPRGCVLGIEELGDGKEADGKGEGGKKKNPADQTSVSTSV